MCVHIYLLLKFLGLMSYILIVNNQKEAETHLPELEARDGISIPMEDIGTSRVWNMRYRYSTINLDLIVQCHYQISRNK